MTMSLPGLRRMARGLLPIKRRRVVGPEFRRNAVPGKAFRGACMGKSSIVYVVGLTLLIGVALLNINQSSVDSLDTYATYFGRTMAHNVALAAANVGTNRILFNNNYASAFSDSFGGGYYAVQFDSTAPMQKKMRVTSTFEAGGETIRDTVYATFNYTIFSRYGWFTEQEKNGYVSASGANGPYYGYSDWKITGDSVFGYAHTNSKFNLGGSPYFDKKVTATNAPTLMSVDGVQNPIYNEGYEWGRTIRRDSANISGLKAISNASCPISSTLLTGKDVGFQFNADGTVRVLVPFNPSGVPWGSSGALLDTTLAMSALSTSKVVGVQSGDIHIKGTYKGQVTLAAFKGATGAATNKGNIWIDGNVVAQNNPQTNQTSTDMLGLVAERMGYITKDATRTMSSVLNIQAAIYCHSGEFTAEDFWTIPKSGRVSLFGSLCQYSAGSLGVFNGSGLQNGFFYSIRHDARFLSTGPPSFPFSTKYRLVAWWEN